MSFARLISSWHKSFVPDLHNHVAVSKVSADALLKKALNVCRK